MQDVILIANSGSSSLKISIRSIHNRKVTNEIYYLFLEKSNDKIIFHIDDQKETKQLLSEQITQDAVKQMINIFATWWEQQNELNLVATGHRIVHGGQYFNQALIVTDKTNKQMQELIPLSPLHQPYNLQVLELFRKKHPNLLHIASFDTAFHSTNSPVSKAFGLPKKYYDKGIIRYGFHGLSYKYISSNFQKLVGYELPKHTIIAHLGNGSSMCALENGISIASSMGFSVLDGIMMGTRPGYLDPGVVLYLLEHEKMTISEVTDLLYRKSGLLGVSNDTSDVRVLLDSKSPDAKFALELFVYRIRLEIGRLTACLNGLDCLIFTAGIGQNSSIIRERIITKLTWLGAKLDEQKNKENNYLISTADSKVKIYALPTDEEKTIEEDIIRFL